MLTGAPVPGEGQKKSPSSAPARMHAPSKIPRKTTRPLLLPLLMHVAAPAANGALRASLHLGHGQLLHIEVEVLVGGGVLQPPVAAGGGGAGGARTWVSWQAMGVAAGVLLASRSGRAGEVSGSTLGALWRGQVAPGRRQHKTHTRRARATRRRSTHTARYQTGQKADAHA